MPTLLASRWYRARRESFVFFFEGGSSCCETGEILHIAGDQSQTVFERGGGDHAVSYAKRTPGKLALTL